MLLDCFTIPCAMGLSYIFLGCRYNCYHFYGVSLCILGLICIVISDISSAETEYGSAPLYGDVRCLIGSGLYAASNVSQEYLVKYHDRDEYLGFVGGCGALISAIQLLSLNYNQLRKTKFTSKVMLSSISRMTMRVCSLSSTTSARRPRRSGTGSNSRFGA